MRIDLIQKIAAYGDEYIERHLQKYNENELSNNQQESLKFLFDHSFYQGRRDCISCKVEKRAINTLKEFIGENNSDFEVIFDEKNFDKIESELKEVIGKGKIGRGRDIEMVISMLEFISKINDKNIINYSIFKIQNGELVNHFIELTNIYSIGPKCSSFYLRDLVCIYDKDVKIRKDELKYLQPIDVWVRKVAFVTEIISDLKEKDKTIREKIVDACSESEVSSIKFNQGAWYLGHNSFDVIIDNLTRNRRFPLFGNEERTQSTCGSFK